MSEESFIASIKDELELDDMDVSMDDAFKEYEDWDSLTFLALMTFLRDECHVQLTIERYNGLNTWRDVYALIS